MVEEGALAPVTKPGERSRITSHKIRTWVGHHQVVIQPVLNMARRDAVDSHDPPGWMRDLVHLRDSHCIFPRCTTAPTAGTHANGPPRSTNLTERSAADECVSLMLANSGRARSGGFPAD